MQVTAINVDDREVRIGLGELRATIADPAPLLSIAGNLMRASVASTFREQGSPAGSWPRLAASTLRNKRYTPGHKLLILSGRLFNSINYQIAGNTLTIGTNLVYARVQQLGSADRSGGSIGAQAKISGRGVAVSSYEALRVTKYRKYGTRQHVGKDGKVRNVHVRAAGPSNATRYHVSSHTRHQNIPARPYLVIRPEDPQRIVSGIEAYLGYMAGRIGKVGAI